MKKIFVISGLLMFFMQFSAIPMMFAGLRLNLMLLMVISMALVYPCKTMLPLAFGAGILVDIFSATGFGLYSICFLVMVFSLDSFRRNVLPERRGVLIAAGVFAAAIIVFDALLYVMNLVFVKFGLSPMQANIFSNGFLQYIWQLLANMAVALPLYFLIDKIERSLGGGRLDLKLINH